MRRFDLRKDQELTLALALVTKAMTLRLCPRLVLVSPIAQPQSTKQVKLNPRQGLVLAVAWALTLKVHQRPGSEIETCSETGHAPGSAVADTVDGAELEAGLG